MKSLLRTAKPAPAVGLCSAVIKIAMKNQIAVKVLSLCLLTEPSGTAVPNPFGKLYIQHGEYLDRDHKS